MNVTVQEKTDEKRRKYLVAEKDFDVGDVIYKVRPNVRSLLAQYSSMIPTQEEPIVTVLDKDLQEQGTYCTHCLRLIHKAIAVTAEGDPLNAVYCSKECQAKSKAKTNLPGLELGGEGWISASGPSSNNSNCPGLHVPTPFVLPSRPH